MARRGEGIRAIARQVGCSRNTVRRYLRDEEARRYGRESRGLQADRVQGIFERAGRASAARDGFRRRCCCARSANEGTRRDQPAEGVACAAEAGEPDPVVRFETPPGQQMQADFTHVRRGRDPLLALVATLGYSRASYVKLRVPARMRRRLCAGLREAFDYFGGVPEHVLFDNTKAVVIERDAYGAGRHRWNDEMNELAEKPAASRRGCAGRIGPRPRARSSASTPT